ncbi:MAG TPA: DUF4142 domain-containing protein [Planctomycetota bacterium]|nr:DUF4142 domain-containing protein [Planctomycetota bacterium]
MNGIGMGIVLVLLPAGLVAADGDGGQAAADVIPVAEQLGGSSSGAEARALSREELQFVDQALSHGMFEVRSSQLLLRRPPKDPREEVFARMMIDDHSEVNRRLQRLVQDRGYVPSTRLDDEHEEMLEELADLDGDELQKRYHAYHATAQEEAIELYEAAARDLEDAQLRAFAQETLTLLRAHADHLATHDAELGR